MQNAECKVQNEGLTPEEIVKSLRVCINIDGLCRGCVYSGYCGGDILCADQLREAAAGLIEAQAGRIEELEGQLILRQNELLKLREENRWIPVEERMLENEVDVLILAERRLYGISETDRRKHHIVATAFHTDGKTNTEDSGYNWELWDTGAEYDEEVDAYIIPEGWWEAVRYGEEFSAVDDIVTHWKPMPKGPEEAGQA